MKREETTSCKNNATISSFHAISSFKYLIVIKGLCSEEINYYNKNEINSLNDEIESFFFFSVQLKVSLNVNYSKL